MAILRVKDNEGNIYDITAIKGDKGDPYILTEEDKAELVDAVLANFTDVSEVAL